MIICIIFITTWPPMLPSAQRNLPLNRVRLIWVERLKLFAIGFAHRTLHRRMSIQLKNCFCIFDQVLNDLSVLDKIELKSGMLHFWVWFWRKSVQRMSFIWIFNVESRVRKEEWSSEKIWSPDDCQILRWHSSLGLAFRHPLQMK